MIFPKTDRVGPAYGQEPTFRSQYISTKLVVVDKRSSQTQPQIFVLSPESVIDTEELQALKVQFLSGFYTGVFIPMGPFLSIDRQKKLVKLPQERLISYQYLIVVNSHLNRDDSSELRSGLNPLIDALRIKKNNALQNMESSRKQPAALESKHVQHLQDNHSIKPDQLTIRSSDRFLDNEKILYEVQIWNLFGNRVRHSSMGLPFYSPALQPTRSPRFSFFPSPS